MNQPQRFKEASTRAGRMMQAGSEERPPAKAMQRAAHQLGVSPSVLAAVLCPTAASAATTGVVTAGARAIANTASKASAWGLTATLTKGGIVGLGVGVALFASAELTRSKAPAPATVATPPMPTVSARLDVLAPRSSGSAQFNVDSPPKNQSCRSPTLPIAKASSNALVSSPPQHDSTGVDRAVALNSSLVAATAHGRDDAQVPGPSNQDQIVGPAATNRAHSPIAATSSASAQENAVPVDVRLAHEIASLDRTRMLANRGNAAGALRELDAFAQRYGFSVLRREATLVRIDLLLGLGRTADATAAAHRLLAMGASGAERVRLEDLLKKRGLSL
jgi:hypothetical protein